MNNTILYLHTLQTVHLPLTFLSHLLKEIFLVGLGLTVIEHQKGTETRNHVTIHGNDAINVPLQILLAYVQKNCSHFAYKINVYHFTYTWYDLEGSSRDKADFELLQLTAQGDLVPLSKEATEDRTDFDSTE